MTISISSYSFLSPLLSVYYQSIFYVYRHIHFQYQVSQATKFFTYGYVFICAHINIYRCQVSHTPTFFILFVATCVSRVVSTVKEPQRFLSCLSSYLFSEWHIVPQLYIQIKQSRTCSRKALDGWKASRRLGKRIRGLSRFLSNHHSASVFV